MHVLMIDDDVSLLGAQAKVLERAGFTVSAARNVVDGSYEQ